MNIPYQSKYDLVKDYPQFLHNMSKDHDLYFATFTFKEMKTVRPYRDYVDFFSLYYRKMTNHVVNNRKSFNVSPTLLLIPEANPALHYHGIAFVHHKTKHRFFNKFTYDIRTEYCEAMKKDCPYLLTHRKFENPYPNSYQTSDEQLKISA